MKRYLGILSMLMVLLTGGCGQVSESGLVKSEEISGELQGSSAVGESQAGSSEVVETVAGSSETAAPEDGCGEVVTSEAGISEASESEAGSCQGQQSTGVTGEPEVGNSETLAPETDSSETVEPKEHSIQLMMVGDNLLHMGVVQTGKQEDGSYNYDFLFGGMEPFLSEAEIKVINQETIFGGNHLGFSGYPTFNSPTEVGDAIVNAGFNVVLHASNHATDKKLEGLQHCLEYWKQYPEMTVVGIHEKEESPIQILTIDGVDFAILNYTYGINRPAIPENIMGLVDMLCNYDTTTGNIDFTQLHPGVLTDIAAAKEMADVVIVCPHWGTEYTMKPSTYQQKFAMQMVEAGADVIIGTHPHVVQPMEWIEAENGNRALCYYSLGNYVSTQKKPLCMLEAMAWIEFRVTEEGIMIEEENTGVVPMVCHYTADPVRAERVYLLENYTEEQAAAHGIKPYGEVDLYLSDLQNWSNEVFGDNILPAEEVLEENVY